jgi:hypothetical protein
MTFVLQTVDVRHDQCCTGFAAFAQAQNTTNSMTVWARVTGRHVLTASVVCSRRLAVQRHDAADGYQCCLGRIVSLPRPSVMSLQAANVVTNQKLDIVNDTCV